MIGKPGEAFFITETEARDAITKLIQEFDADSTLYYDAYANGAVNALEELAEKLGVKL